MFCKRLQLLREELKLNKREMSIKLNISESYYNLIESGKREPSKTVLYKLVVLSNKPEEYWLYGIEDNNELIQARQEFKCTKAAFSYLLNCKELNEDIIDNLFDTILDKTSDIEKLILKGIKADLKHLYNKEQSV